jgi:hypothetical protein
VRGFEMGGIAIQKEDEIRKDVTQLVTCGERKHGVGKGNNHRSGGTYMLARGMRIITMIRCIRRKYVLRFRDGYPRSTAFCKETGLE